MFPVNVYKWQEPNNKHSSNCINYVIPYAEWGIINGSFWFTERWPDIVTKQQNIICHCTQYRVTLERSTWKNGIIRTMAYDSRLRRHRCCNVYLYVHLTLPRVQQGVVRNISNTVQRMEDTNRVTWTGYNKTCSMLPPRTVPDQDTTITVCL